MVFPLLRVIMQGLGPKRNQNRAKDGSNRHTDQREAVLWRQRAAAVSVLRWGQLSHGAEGQVGGGRLFLWFHVGAVLGLGLGLDGVG